MRNKAETEATIQKIRAKWEHAERLVIDCDPKAIYSISDVEKILEQHNYLALLHEYDVITKDTEIIKHEFANSCICRKKKQ